MRTSQELVSHIRSDVRRLMSTEMPEIREFYGALTAPEQKLSPNFLAQTAPEWNSFDPISADDELAPLTRAGVTPQPSELPWLFMPDSPSAGGKTSLTRRLAHECPDCVRIIKTCTTRPMQLDERKSAKKETIRLNPEVVADVSAQYWHVTEKQFQELSMSDFFIETRPMWENGIRKNPKIHYGIPRASMEKAGLDKVPFSFLVVDEVGQKAALEWLTIHKHDTLAVQKWFILPTGQTFNDLAQRIMFLRTEQAAERIVDAVKDLYYGAGRTDVIIPNPIDKSGTPVQAIATSKKLLNMLRPGVLVP